MTLHFFLKRWHYSAFVFRINSNSRVDCFVIDAFVSRCPKKKFDKYGQRTKDKDPEL